MVAEAFLVELFRHAFHSKEVARDIVAHLKYEHLPTEGYKKILKSIEASYKTLNDTTSVGVVAQQYPNDLEVAKTLSKIQDVKLSTSVDSLKEQFETYVKNAMFINLYDKVAEMWNRGEKDEATALLAGESEKIVNFTLKTGTIDRVFSDFEERQNARVSASSISSTPYYIPYGIDELDVYTGGLERSEMALFTARSGVGKSTALRWFGLSAARRGYRVLHIQAEGGKQACLLDYDSLWTGVARRDLRFGDYPEEKGDKFRKIVKDITGLNAGAIGLSGEIFVEGSDKFGGISTLYLRQLVDKLCNKMGLPPHLILVDYLEKLSPVGASGRVVDSDYGDKGEQTRRVRIGEQFKDICVEFSTRLITATQASTVSPEQYNNANFHMTRYNISQLKAIVDPFAVHITLNQTDAELEQDLMRLYIDKDRYNKPGGVISIYQKRNMGRFYDGPRTRAEILKTQ